MEIRVLRYFLAICEAKNISKAAQSLHLSQPSLSRQIKNLEDELGVTLFTRGHQEISLTQEGYYLRDHAQEIINMVDKTKQNIEQSEIISGELWIGAGESIAMKRIMQVVDSILRQYPEVKVHFYAGIAPAIEAKIDRGVLDFGLTMGGQDKLNNYESLSLPEKNEYGIIVNKNHPLADKEYVTADDIAPYPLLISQRTAISEAFLHFEGGSHKLNIVSTFNLVYNTKYLVQLGNYCLFTYKNFIETQNKDLVYLPIHPHIYDNNRVIWRKNAELSNVAKLFLEKLRESLNNF